MDTRQTFFIILVTLQVRTGCYQLINYNSIDKIAIYRKNAKKVSEIRSLK